MLPSDCLVRQFHSHLLVTDQYSAYKYIDGSKRQLCWAHILRNVIAIEGTYSVNGCSHLSRQLNFNSYQLITGCVKSSSIIYSKWIIRRQRF
ncbi:IS66 family transposase [Vibrio metschnikovii]|nr:transposase [Vibrio metschnikovii]